MYRIQLLFRALIKFSLGLVLVGLLLFLPAGGLDYWGAWLFLALLFIPMLGLGVVLLIHSPALLEKRLSAKEKEMSQKWVVALSGLLFLGGFLFAGLDHRLGWTSVPLPLVMIASILLLVGYGMYAEVMRENAYLSRTIEVQNGQTVIDKGLYGIVRHPMYLATVLLFLSIPIVLGSWISFLFFLFYPAVIVVRIHNEEKVLTAELNGYIAYTQNVKYRLIPFVW